MNSRQTDYESDTTNLI